MGGGGGGGGGLGIFVVYLLVAMKICFCLLIFHLDAQLYEKINMRVEKRVDQILYEEWSS